MVAQLEAADVTASQRVVSALPMCRMTSCGGSTTTVSSAGSFGIGTSFVVTPPAWSNRSSPFTIRPAMRLHGGEQARHPSHRRTRQTEDTGRRHRETAEGSEVVLDHDRDNVRAARPVQEVLRSLGQNSVELRSSPRLVLRVVSSCRYASEP